MSPQTNKDLMISGPIYSKLVRFAVPVFFGALFQQMYNAVDSLIVGNFLGSTSLAAVSSAGSLIFLIVGFFNGLSMGAGVVVSQYIGAEDDLGTEQAVHTKVALGLLSAAFLTVFGILFTPLMLQWMDTPSDVLPESISYFRFYFAGSVGLVMYNTLVGILQSAGDSRHPLVYLIVSSLVNVGLDLLFIGVFGWGVWGAALATSISQVLSATLCLIRLVRIKTNYRVIFSKIRIHMDMLKKILRFGIPSGVQNSVMALSNVVIQSYVNSFGSVAMAGVGAFSKLEGFGGLPVQSFAMAVTTFVGQNMGAREYGRVKKAIVFSMICAPLLSELIGIACSVFAPSLVALFDPNPAAIVYGAARARTVMPFFVLCALTHTTAAALRGLGKPMVPMFSTLFFWCVGRISLLWLSNLVGMHTIEVTYWVYPITWGLTAVFLSIYYARLDVAKLPVQSR